MASEEGGAEILVVVVTVGAGAGVGLLTAAIVGAELDRDVLLKTVPALRMEAWVAR